MVKHTNGTSGKSQFLFDVDADKAVVDGNLVTSPAWPGDSAIIAEFVKLMGTVITL